MGNVRYLNAPAFDPYLSIRRFFETVLWFQEKSMFHALSHRLTSTPAQAPVLVIFAQSFRCCDVFSPRVYINASSNQFAGFFLQQFSFKFIDDNSCLDSCEKCCVARLESSVVIAFKGAFRGIDGVKGLIEVITSIQKT